MRQMQHIKCSTTVYHMSVAIECKKRNVAKPDALSYFNR